MTTTASSNLTGATGCNLLSFDPALTVAAGSETRSTTGLDLDLTVPQEVSPAFPTPPPAKSVDVDFSGGLRLDSTAAADHPSCSAEQAAIGVEGPGSCPAEARVGSVRIGTPLVPEMLGGPNPLRAAARSGGAHPRQAPAEVTGSVYFGGSSRGGHRLYLLGSGFGIDLKLVLTLDHRSRIRGADRQRQPAEVPDREDRAPTLRRSAGLLRTAVRCGEYPVQSTVSTWNGSLGPFEGTQQLTHRLRARRDAMPRPGRSGPRRALALAAAGRREIEDDGAGDRGRRRPGPGPGRGGRVQLERPRSPDRAGDRQRRRQLQRRADRLEHDRDADDHRDRDLGRPRNQRIGAPAPGLAELTGFAAARPRRWRRRSTRSRR